MVLVDYAVIGYFITLGVFVKIVVGQIYPKLILKTVIGDDLTVSYSLTGVSRV